MPDPILLIHHSAHRDHPFPDGSPPALRACLEAGARVIEVDISLLADGQFALLHGPLLERETTGVGPIAALTSEQVQALHYVHREQRTPTTVPIGLLPEALDLLRQFPETMELQLDLKPRAYSRDVLERLLLALEPVKERVRVTSPSDWAVRHLRRLDPALPLGFDPLLYMVIDPGTQGRDPGVPPFRRGAYGYWDDHPLSTYRWGSTADYLASRAEALWAQAPTGAIWYIDAALLGQALDDGFDWIAYLHSQGAIVDAWTLDAHRPERLHLAQRLATAGVDRITTNNAPALSQALQAASRY